MALPVAIEQIQLLHPRDHLVLPVVPGGHAVGDRAAADGSLARQASTAEQGQVGRAQMLAVGEQALGADGGTELMGTGRQPSRGGVAEDHLAAEWQAEIVERARDDRLHQAGIEGGRNGQIRQGAHQQLAVVVQLGFIEVRRREPVLHLVMQGVDRVRQASDQVPEPCGSDQDLIGIEGVDPFRSGRLGHLHQGVHERLFDEGFLIEANDMDPLPQWGGLQCCQTSGRAIGAAVVENVHRIDMVSQGVHQGDRHEGPLVLDLEQADDARRWDHRLHCR